MSWKRDYQWEQTLKATLGDTWKGETPRAFRKGLLEALVSRDEIATGDLRWHVSLKHRDRIPTWEELVQAGHELRPGVVFVIAVPPRSWWINVHPHVLHLYEIKDMALTAQWRAEARGDRPT
jgi:hypothetical protein